MKKLQLIDAIVDSLQIQEKAIVAVTGLIAIAATVPANREFSLLTKSKLQEKS